MHKVSVGNLAEGMVLARPVEDRLGRVLLVKGDALQGQDRRRLSDWGIVEIWVEGDAVLVEELLRLAGPIDTAPEAAEIARKVESRFRDFGEDHAIMAGLKALAIRHLSAPPPRLPENG